MSVTDGGPNPIARTKLTPEDGRGQWVLNLLLDRAFERPCPIDRIVPRFTEEVPSLVVERELDIALEETLAQIAQLNVHDRADLLIAERLEHHDVVDPVDEFRPEGLLDDLHHGVLHALIGSVR